MKPIAAVVMLGLSALALAQNRDTLETKVTAKGQHVLLEWSKKHPWDGILQARGAFLVISYRVAEGGQVKEDCLAGAAGRVGRPAPGFGCLGVPGAVAGRKDDRTLSFPLPQQLTDAPAGPVCLSIRTGEGRPLPVRKADGGDTARFRVETWERGVAAKARRAEFTAEIARLEQEHQITAGNVRKIEAANGEKGWHDAAACAAIRAPKVDLASSPHPVAPPDAHDGFARQVCILRVVNAELNLRDLAAKVQAEGKASGSEESTRLLLGLRTGEVLGPATLAALLNLLPEQEQAAFKTRASQLLQFDADWKQFASQVSAYLRSYSTPHFGRASDTLRLQQETRLAGAVLAAGKLDPVAVRGFVGASLEAYGRCVEDGKRQLATRYQSAVELEAKTPELQARVGQEMQQACRAGLARLEQEREKQKRFQQSLEAARAALTQVAEPHAGSAPERVLNAIACSP